MIGPGQFGGVDAAPMLRIDERARSLQRGAQQVPAEPERIRGKRNDELSGHQKEFDVVREVIGDGNGDD
jgi:hypothetical protein